MTVHRMPITELMQTVRPGSYDRPWSWLDEARWLWTHQPGIMANLVQSILADGQQEPVKAGFDGRMWDGHHRVFALLAAGESMIDVEFVGASTRVDPACPPPAPKAAA